VNKNKGLCRTCFKNRPEYGPTPRKKTTTCEDCKTRGQLHRDSDWLWNMLVTRKPRKGKKKHKILWSEETLRDQLWWLKPRKVKAEVKQQDAVKQDAVKQDAVKQDAVKQEVKQEPGVLAGMV
jgi:hypothetical protein